MGGTDPTENLRNDRDALLVLCRPVSHFVYHFWRITDAGPLERRILRQMRTAVESEDPREGKSLEKAVGEMVCKQKFPIKKRFYGTADTTEYEPHKKVWGGTCENKKAPEQNAPGEGPHEKRDGAPTELESHGVSSHGDGNLLNTGTHRRTPMGRDLHLRTL